MRERIDTGRLVLRPPDETDIPRIIALANNWSIAEKLARLPHPYGEADARAFLGWIEKLPPSSACFAIGCKAEGGAFIGTCGYDTMHADKPDLGYWLGEPHWGCGYASEAAAAVVRHAFEITGLEFLTSGCRPDNPASRRVLEKIGFRPAGRKMMFSLGAGREFEIETFRLTREQWLEASPGMTTKRSRSQP